MRPGQLVQHGGDALLDVVPLVAQAVLDLYITHAKNGVRFSQRERECLRRMRDTGHRTTIDAEVNAA